MNIKSPLNPVCSVFSKLFWSFAVLLFLLISSCETPEKVLRSNDLSYKKAKAIYWYNKKEYFKCIPVMEELIGLMKGRESVEELYYMYCMANYKQGDYMISGYHFKYFYDQYPNSIYAEECLFMHAKSYQMLSPKPDLDQTYTYQALDAYELFVNMYPDGKYIKECNEAVAKLRKKLEKKALNAADLYYKTSNFKAAATSYENILRDFPDIDESEKVTFMIVKARFRYAQNSVAQRKVERFNNVIKSYHEFKYKFSGSKYIAEAAGYEQLSHYLAAWGAFEWAEVAPFEEREKYFRQFFNELTAQKPYITDKKQLDRLDRMNEKAYFLIVRSNFLISEEKKSREKLPWLKQTVKTYEEFNQHFHQGNRFAAEAARLNKNAAEQLESLEKYLPYYVAKEAYEVAAKASIENREEYFKRFFAELEVQQPKVTDVSQLEALQQMKERAYFTIVRDWYEASSWYQGREKLPYLQQTVKTYFTFVAQFPKSSYKAKAEGIYKNASKLLEKLQSNG